MDFIAFPSRAGSPLERRVGFSPSYETSMAMVASSALRCAVKPLPFAALKPS
jgi:hypothetical protein